MHAKISVLIPAFDAATTLATCLGSVLRQREDRWECIVVDDGSKDATAEVARTFARRDRRFRLVQIDHSGLLGALAAGLPHCRRPYIARMDADDWMHRDRLGEQLRHLEEDETLAAIGCHVRCFPRRELTAGRLAYEAWLNSIATPEQVRREAFVECPVAHPSLMIRAPVLHEFGYRDLGWPEDYDLVLRLLAAEHRIGVVPRRLLAWRDSEARLSRNGAAYRLERFIACKAAHIADSFLRDATEYTLWGHGDTGRALLRALLEHGRRPRRIVELHPRRLGQTIHGALVIAPDRLLAEPRGPIVVSVAGPEPRGQIRTALEAMGFAEERDFVCAA